MLKKCFKFFFAFTFTGVALCLSINMIMTAVIHSNKEVITPNIIGKNLVEALDELEKIDCSLEKSGEEFNQQIPNGVILSQAPSAGVSIREGKSIKVVLSKGGEVIYVPDLFGQSTRAADALLMSANLVMGEVARRYSVAAEKGFVVTQDIEPGTIVEKDSVIGVTVSDGPPIDGTILMPNFVNKHLSDVQNWSVDNNIELKIIYQKTENEQIDIIIKQIPQPDTDITSSKKSEIYVADNSNSNDNNVVYSISTNNNTGSTGAAKNVVEQPQESVEKTSRNIKNLQSNSGGSSDGSNASDNSNGI
ncbi:MAG: PASTA domain-containing protein [Elusimicrobiota bacterium]|nr:PASTA domain-containing protein [Elusimicrobiota bacterium]